MSTHQLQVNNSGAWKTVLHFDGNVLMLTSEIGPLIRDLVKALGGEA